MAETPATRSLFASVTDAEAEALIRVVLGNADFPETDFTDAINLAIDVCYRAAAQMLDAGDQRLTDRTKTAISLRRQQGRL